MSDRTYRSYQYLLGALVTLGTLVVYSMTVAPTLSYWDCGEFISCSYILGIPHPPGTPLYVLIGRIFSMLPISISGLGVREGAFVLFFGLIGIKPEVATAISLSWFMTISAAGIIGLIEYIRYKKEITVIDKPVPDLKENK